ncbi:NAD(P)-dependent oxidoreductase [Bacillus licheniformis]|nr:NAD(P)-dependent oxidoreductase [Bacillus licheniformis]
MWNMQTKRDSRHECTRPNASAVADLAFGLLLSGARSIPQSNAAVKAGLWQAAMGYELDGKRWGLSVWGNRQKVARRAAGFNMNVWRTAHTKTTMQPNG